MNGSHHISKNSTPTSLYKLRRAGLIALIISLFLHLGITLYLAIEKANMSLPFLENANQQPQAVLPEQQPTQQKTPEWVETKASSSTTVGTPVIFQDVPDEEMAPYMPHTDSEISSSDDASDNQQTESTRPEDPIDTLVDASSTTTIAATAIAPLSQTQTVPPSAQAKITTSTPNAPRKPSSTSTPLALNKKSLTLAQFAQGVLHYAQEEGHHAVSMIGKKEGIPSDEQLKYERYLQKLDWCLHNALSMNQHRIPLSNPTSRTMHVLLSLTKEGTLHRLAITKPSGDQRLDAFILFIFQDASSSFPPVPHYLPHNPFTITFVINTYPEHHNIAVNRRP